jgi:hypothetical protein
MQSVEVEDLFETNIPFFRHVASYRGFFFTSVVSCSIPASLVFSQVDTALSFLHQVPLLIHTCHMSQLSVGLHSEFGS